MAPQTSLQPSLILISRTQIDQKFFIELANIESIRTQIANLKAGKNSNNLADGMFVRPREFRDFYNFKITSQIAALRTQYKEYSSYRLSDISVKINMGRNKQQFTEIGNSIYVPRIGNSPVISNLAYAKLRHQNYIQVVLDESIVSSKYLELFFSSELGQLVLQSLYSSSIIPHINKSDLLNVIVPVPPMEEQNSIILTSTDLFRLTERIDDFKRELSLNPRSATKIREKVVDLLEQLNLLSDNDKVLSLIRRGESKLLEFKQTLSLDVRKGKKEKYIEKEVLKTIVGFLNTDGGILLVGISDDGRVVGLEGEISLYNNNLDRYLLHFKNLVKAQIGEDFYPYIDYRMVDVNGKLVLFVECEASAKPCFLNQKEFFVRTNPATDLLEGPKLIEYIRHRFGE